MSTKEELLAKVVDIYDNNELGDRLALMADMMDLYPTNYEDSLDKKNLLDEMIKNMLSIDESYQNCFDLMKKDGDNKYLEQIADFVENGGNNLIALHDNNSEKNYFILITENEKKLSDIQLLNLLAREEHLILDNANIRKYYIQPTNKTEEDEKHSVQQKK